MGDFGVFNRAETVKQTGINSCACYNQREHSTDSSQERRDDRHYDTAQTDHHGLSFLPQAGND